MEIDHFDPTLKGSRRHRYENLFPATHHCNNAKRDNWPTAGDRRNGLRILNCCEEEDYGVHLFEDPDTHLLVGGTPAGHYHIEVCDLNAPHFVRERRLRSTLKHFVEEVPVTVSGDLDDFSDKFNRLRKHLDLLIPPIPAP